MSISAAGTGSTLRGLAELLVQRHLPEQRLDVGGGRPVLAGGRDGGGGRLAGGAGVRHAGGRQRRGITGVHDGALFHQRQLHFLDRHDLVGDGVEVVEDLDRAFGVVAADDELLAATENGDVQRGGNLA